MYLPLRSARSVNCIEITSLLVHRNCMGNLGKEIVGLETLESIIRDSFAATCLGFSQFTKSTSQITFFESITLNSIYCAIGKLPEFYY